MVYGGFGSGSGRCFEFGFLNDFFLEMATLQVLNPNGKTPSFFSKKVCLSLKMEVKQVLGIYGLT